MATTKLKIKDPTINKSDPFNTTNDVLNRKQSAEVLTNIINTIDEPFVIGLDSPWGSGKTTFVNMWRQDLINNGYPTIYFNAWENDFSDNALITILAEFENGISEIKEQFDITSEVYEKFEQVRKTSTKFLKTALPSILKLATYGIIDLKEWKEKDIAEFVEKFAKGKIEEYETSKKTLKSFKHQLEEFIQVLNKSERCGNKPLIIFIDELDRCRPIFAIEILEKVKHFFGVKGIVFILAIDKEQIGNTVSSVYGQNVKPNGYLKKFIDLDYNLPRPAPDVFINFLLDSYNFDEFFGARTQSRFGPEREEIVYIFDKLSFMFSLTLRELQHLFSNLSLVIRMTKNHSPIFALPLSFLVILKYVNHELFNLYINGSISWKEIVEYVDRQKRKSNLFQNVRGYELIAHFVWFEYKDYYTSGSNRKEFTVVLDDQNSTREDRDRADVIIRSLDRLNELSNTYGAKVLENIAKKIELLDNFAY
ncbi:MAG: hypothetical protein FD122_3358 [Stygiobacter sp.]|nr:MAG: hypothetical protein FD122_3358 [Stygiobacter sp.]KAF0214909.1 MAG: hypothetical protein FD178_2071 [Ignavibacteria bacterium]